MRYWGMVLVTLAVTAAATGQARGQARAQNRLSVSVAAIAVGPLSDSADRFSPGPGLDLGASWRLSEQAAVKFDYVFATLGSQDWPTPPLPVQVRVVPRIQYGTAAFVFRAPPEKVRLYVQGGTGVYSRSVDLSGPGGAVQVPPICDPWWLICESSPGSASRLSGTRSTTNVCVNLGAGLAYKRVFTEINYHYMWGPQFSTTSGNVRAT